MPSIYNLKNLRDLLIDFYNLTQLRIAVFDNHFQEILAYPTRLSTFCNIIRMDNTLNEKCKQCDYNALIKCRNTKEPVIYQCHTGQSELVVPIVSLNTIIGYIICGQIYTTDTQYPNWDSLYKILKEYHLDFPDLELAYQNKKRLSPMQFKSAAHIIHICSSQLSQTEHSLHQESLSYEIDSYILGNITQNLDVTNLCTHFNYRKTTFHKITNELFGTSITKHIRELRIQYAKQLLSSTNLPVSEVAIMVGIEDYNYFTKVFKQETLCTPRDFRKRNLSLPKQ